MRIVITPEMREQSQVEAVLLWKRVYQGETSLDVIHVMMYLHYGDKIQLEVSGMDELPGIKDDWGGAAYWCDYEVFAPGYTLTVYRLLKRAGYRRIK